MQSSTPALMHAISSIALSLNFTCRRYEERKAEYKYNIHHRLSYLAGRFFSQPRYRFGECTSLIMEALSWDDPQSPDDYPQPQHQSHTSFPTPLPPSTQQPYPFLQTMCVAPQNHLPLFHVDGDQRGKTDDIDYNVFYRHEEAASAIDDQHPSYHSTHSHYNPWSSGQEASHHFAHGMHSAHQSTGGFVVQQPAPYSQHVWIPSTSGYSNQDDPAHPPHAQGWSDWAQAPAQDNIPPPKPARAKRACTRCQGRKQRCDKKQPCLPCEKNHVPCVYPSSSVVRDHILLREEMRKEIEKLKETIAVQGKVINRLEQERRDVVQTPASSGTLSGSEGFTPSGYRSRGSRNGRTASSS